MEVLPPGMQDREKPDRRAQTFGVGRDSEQCFRSRAEQDAIDLACILKRQPADLLRQRKNNVEIGEPAAVRLASGPATLLATMLGTLGNVCRDTNYTR